MRRHAPLKLACTSTSHNTERSFLANQGKALVKQGPAMSLIQQTAKPAHKS